MAEYYKEMLPRMSSGGVLYLRDEQSARDLEAAAKGTFYSVQRLSAEIPRGLSNKIAVMITKNGISAA